MNISACPTIHNFLESSDIFVIEFSGKGFLVVKAGRYDFVVTGRPPSPIESEGLKTIIIEEGHTIIGPANANIYFSELKNIRVSNCAGIIGGNEFIVLSCTSYPENNSFKIINWNDWIGEPFITVYDDATRLKSIEYRGVYLIGKENDMRISKVANKIYDLM